jgi:hypothetical protein
VGQYQQKQKQLEIQSGRPMRSLIKPPRRLSHGPQIEAACLTMAAPAALCRSSLAGHERQLGQRQEMNGHGECPLLNWTWTELNSGSVLLLKKRSFFCIPRGMD